MQALPEHQTSAYLAFGDLFLEDIRRYREDRLGGAGFTPLFSMQGSDTVRLAETMSVTGVNPLGENEDLSRHVRPSGSSPIIGPGILALSKRIMESTKNSGAIAALRG